MNPEKSIRILLIDDHEIVRQGLRSLIESHPGWEVCGEAGDGRQAVKLAKALTPDIAVMDLSMPEMNGLEAARTMLKRAPGLQVIILSMHDTEQMVQELVGVGVQGYVLKSDAVPQLQMAIETVLRGEAYFTSPVARRLHRSRSTNGKARRSLKRVSGTLTPREREIVQLLSEGKTNREVGEILRISVKTAETHRARIMRKLAVASVADLVRYAIRNGISAV